MLDIEDFDVVFNTQAGYTDVIWQGIEENKRSLHGKTFFERLLELLQIKWRRIYPPKSNDQLRELHKRIATAPISLHYKHCLFFYLLKDLAPALHDQTELATWFAGQVHLEKGFLTLIEGLWALDHLQLETAIGHLTHPSIIPTFPDAILSVLLHVTRNIGTTEQTAHAAILPLAYYNCANPPLAGEDVRVEYTKYMAERNVTDTFYWLRTRPTYEQKQLFEILVQQTLDGHNWNRDEGHLRADKALELVGLPFTNEEEKWIHAFLTEGKGRTSRGAWDTVEIRRIATGKMKEAATDSTHRGKTIKGQPTWSLLRDSMQRGLGPRQEDTQFLP